MFFSILFLPLIAETVFSKYQVPFSVSILAGETENFGWEYFDF